MRKLASIQRVVELFPIEGKDRIELATVLGWRVIVQKGLYKVGDLCVYCEPDSLMPERPEFEFLRSKKFKIKTMKMAGVYSEGIVFPLDILPTDFTKVSEGEDVTDVLGVKHVDEADPVEDTFDEQRAAVKAKGRHWKWMLRFPVTRHIAKAILSRNHQLKKQAERFPSFIRKTDEPRIQTLPHLENQTRSYVCREKLDGSSMTVFLVRKPRKWYTPFWKRDEYEFGVCSRNRRLLYEDKNSSKFLAMVDKYDLKFVLQSLIGDKDWVVIQGELIGEGVQGNIYKLPNNEFRPFNLIYPDGRVPCTVGEVVLLAHGLRWCPLVGVIESPFTVEGMLEYATAPSKLNPDTTREGIVCRNYTDNISFKAVSPEYLLSKGG